MKKGCLIVIDGGNGAGKSTVLKLVEDLLQAEGHEYVMTREPGGTAIGDEIRRILLSPDNKNMCGITELMLFAAGRAQHIKEKILPAIESGKIVVSDRFDSATYSFQHYARGLSIDLIRTLNDIALDGFKPTKTIILDIDPMVGLKRAGARNGEPDRFEAEKMDFQNKARRGYLTQAEQDPERFAVVDASQPLAGVVAEVTAIIKTIITQ